MVYMFYKRVSCLSLRDFATRLVLDDPCVAGEWLASPFDVELWRLRSKSHRLAPTPLNLYKPCQQPTSLVFRTNIIPAQPPPSFSLLKYRGLSAGTVLGGLVSLDSSHAGPGVFAALLRSRSAASFDHAPACCASRRRALPHSVLPSPDLLRLASWGRQTLRKSTRKFID